MMYKHILFISLTCLFYTCQPSIKTANDCSYIPSIAHATGVEKGLNVLIVGDWGRNGAHHQSEVAHQMKVYGNELSPRFIISTGDNFYPDGVKSTSDDQWKTSFENIYTGKALQCKWYTVLGNHDHRGNTQAQIDYSKISTRWNMPSRYYTFSEAINDTTFSRFIFLDTHPLVAHNSEHHSDLPQHYAKQQLKWLDSVLLHANEKWKIVVAHHPIYSSSPRHGDSQKLIELLKPQLEKYGVQLYISGHDHDLQHQKPDGKIDYIVSGAGSQIRKSASNSNTKFSKGISGFAALSIQHDSLHINFINYKGAIEYYYSRGE